MDYYEVDPMSNWPQPLSTRPVATPTALTPEGTMSKVRRFAAAGILAVGMVASGAAIVMAASPDPSGTPTPAASSSTTPAASTAPAANGADPNCPNM